MKEEKRKKPIGSLARILATTGPPKPAAKILAELMTSTGPPKPAAKILAELMTSTEPPKPAAKTLAEFVASLPPPKPAAEILAELRATMGLFTAKPAAESEILGLKKQVADLRGQMLASHSAHESEILELKKQIADLRRQVREKERPPKPPKPPWYERLKDRNLELVKLFPKILWRLAPLGTAIGWGRKFLEFLQREPAEAVQP